MSDGINKVIALDIGGVCMHLHVDQSAKAMGWSDAEIPIDVLQGVVRMETGIIQEEDFLQIVHRHTGSKFTDTELVEAWNLVLGDGIDGMHDLIEEITELGFRFVFFSDTSPVHLLEIFRKLPFAHLVSGGIYSFDVGAQKPDRAMYEAFEKEHGKPFFYLDDKPCNIEGGQEAGWYSHRFTDAESFRQDFFSRLKAEGLGE